VVERSTNRKAFLGEWASVVSGMDFSEIGECLHPFKYFTGNAILAANVRRGLERC
jgi:hypothetical protein